MSEETLNRIISRYIAKTLQEIEANPPRLTKDIIKKKYRHLQKDLLLQLAKR